MVHGTMQRLGVFVITAFVSIGVGAAVLLVGSGFSLLAIYSVLVILISLWLVQKTVRLYDLNRMTIPGFWYFSYIIIMYIPGFSIYFEGIPPYRDLFMFSMQSALITVPLGFLLINLILGVKTDEIKAYYDRPLKERESALSLGVTNWGFILGAVAITLLYLTEVQHIALLELLRNPGDWAYYQEVREESFNALRSSFVYAYSLLREMFYPFLIASTLGYYLRFRRRSWLFMFLLSALIGLGFASLSGAKGPPSIILMVLGIFIYLYKGGRINRFWIALWAVVLLMFPVFILVEAGGGRSWEALGLVFETLGIRIFEASPLVAYKYFEIFPDEVGFLHGGSIQKLAWLTGRPYFNTGYYVLSRIFSNPPESGSAGGAFFASFYADFGMPGVLVGGLLTGVILQGIQVYLMRGEKTVAKMAVMAFMFYAFLALNGRALPVVLLGTGTVFALFLPIVVKTSCVIVTKVLRLAPLRYQGAPQWPARIADPLRGRLYRDVGKRVSRTR
jgi:hypothetical protein